MPHTRLPVLLSSVAIVACGSADPTDNRPDVELDGEMTEESSGIQISVLPEAESAPLCEDSHFCEYIAVFEFSTTDLEIGEYTVGDDVSAEIDKLDCNNTLFATPTSGTVNIERVTDALVELSWDVELADDAGGFSSTPMTMGRATVWRCP